LVAVNPYRELPIYTDGVMQWYRQGNSGRADRPPHIFAVADEAYRAMLSTRSSQSILITGESGAGKTENTKRVIQYLANISCANGSLGSQLEDRIIQANPILEAFGNAQTIRNNNSSRFGKFVKIEFGPGGQIVGGHVERYLLEKGRVTNCGERERNFHVFYQFLLGAEPELKAKFGITGGLDDYEYVRRTRKAVDGINDKADYTSLQVLGCDRG
jgi:myosin protein heavy chain